jgi:DNA invertase Pin-like site-specific DNA recombinase
VNSLRENIKMKGQHIGYVRVSSIIQNTDRQLADIELDEVFTDKVSGKDVNRPELQACLKHLRKGDTLHVHSIDRLARNLSDLEKLVGDLSGRGVTVVFHKENMTFDGGDNAMQTLMLQVMGAFSQFERSLINERRREGMALAKAKGTHIGRPKTINDDARLEMVSAVMKGEPKQRVAQRYGISRTTLYKIIKENEATASSV